MHVYTIKLIGAGYTYGITHTHTAYGGVLEAVEVEEKLIPDDRHTILTYTHEHISIHG